MGLANIQFLLKSLFTSFSPLVELDDLVLCCSNSDLKIVFSLLLFINENFEEELFLHLFIQLYKYRLIDIYFIV